MHLPVLALFNRYLQEEPRQMRSVMAKAGLLGITLLALLTATQTRGMFGAPGLRFFSSIIYVDFFFISFLGLELFGSAIAEEKEARTLGLLRMTALSPLAILLGKSTTRLISVLVLLILQFPFVSLAVTLGGISLTQVGAAYILLATYTVYLCNLALLCSVLLPRTRDAAGMTAVLLVLSMIIPASAPGVVAVLVDSGWLPQGGGVTSVLEHVTVFFRDALPPVRFSRILRTGYAGGLLSWQALLSLAEGGLFFALAWLSFDRYSGTESAAGPVRGAVTRRTSRLRFISAGRCWARALAWKEFNFTAGSKAAFALKMVAFPVVLAFVCYQADSTIKNIEDALTFCSQVLLVSALLLLAAELSFCASRLFWDDVRWRTLPMLAMLPCSQWDLVKGKILGYLLSMIPAVIYFCLGVVLDVMTGCGGVKAFFEVLDEPAFWCMVAACVFVLYLTVFLSLRMKSGAFAVALGSLVVGVSVLQPVALMVGMGGFLSHGVGLVLITFVLMLSSISLHGAIGARLRQVAGEL